MEDEEDGGGGCRGARALGVRVRLRPARHIAGPRSRRGRASLAGVRGGEPAILRPSQLSALRASPSEARSPREDSVLLLGRAQERDKSLQSVERSGTLWSGRGARCIPQAHRFSEISSYPDPILSRSWLRFSSGRAGSPACPCLGEFVQIFIFPAAWEGGEAVRSTPFVPKA